MGLPALSLGPAPAAFSIRRHTPRVAVTGNKLTAFGSSTSGPGTSSVFTGFNNGIPARALLDFIAEGLEPAPASTQAITNYAAGGATKTGIETQADNAIAAGFNNASYFVQSEGQSSDFVVQGGGHILAKWFKNTFRPKFDSTVTSQKRFISWVGSFGSEQGFGSNAWTCSVQFVQKLWDDYPGQVVNGTRYVQFMPRDGSEQDLADANTGAIPKSLQVPDRSHGSNRGRRMKAKFWMIYAAEAFEGGLPFFPDHCYFSNAATAQTNGGAVVTLGFIGSLTGCTLSLRNADGSPSVDFAINSSTAAVTRASGTLIKKPVDLFLDVRRDDQLRTYHIEIAIGNLTTTPVVGYVDGNVGATIWSNDNTGTEESPTYTPASARVFAGVGTGITEGTVVLLIQPDAPLNGGSEPTMYMAYHSGGIQIQRLTTGAVRVSMRDEAGNTFGQLTSGATEATGRCTNADGLRWVFYTFSCANDRQRLMVVNDADGVVKYDSGNVSLTARTTGAMNPLASVQYLFLGGTANAYSNNYKGRHGPRWQATKEIDMSASANRALFRSGAGTLADLGATGAVTPASGPNAGVSITPFDYWNGHPSELVAGIQLGTGGRWCAWQRRKLYSVIKDWTQGVPYIP